MERNLGLLLVMALHLEMGLNLPWFAFGSFFVLIGFSDGKSILGRRSFACVCLRSFIRDCLWCSQHVPCFCPLKHGFIAQIDATLVPIAKFPFGGAGAFDFVRYPRRPQTIRPQIDWYFILIQSIPSVMQQCEFVPRCHCYVTTRTSRIIVRL